MNRFFAAVLVAYIAYIVIYGTPMSGDASCQDALGTCSLVPESSGWCEV